MDRVAPEGMAISALERVDFADAFEIAIGPRAPTDLDLWWDRVLATRRR